MKGADIRPNKTEENIKWSNNCSPYNEILFAKIQKTEVTGKVLWYYILRCEKMDS